MQLHTSNKLAAITLTSLLAAGSASAVDIPLASTMNPAGGLSENAVTGSQARIGLGDGTAGDADGLYNIADDSTLFSAIDLFPKEDAFSVGSLTVDASGLTGSGVETLPIDAIDLSSLWSPGSSSTDISDTGLSLWFFDASTTFAFGTLDASDTVTVTDGILSGIDLSLDATYATLDGGGNTVTWNGTFSIAGDAVALSFNDTQNFDTGFFGVVPSTFTSNLTGSVDAVDSLSIPEPAALSTIGLLALAAQRRRIRG